VDSVELLKKLISFNSVTPNDGGAFEFIKSYLPDFEIIEAEKEGVKNLFLYKKFGDGKHICFAGHIDVVPAGGEWNSDPFCALEQDGVVYGRGAADMKGGVAAFLYTLKHTAEFNGTLSALLTSDEEGDAIYGTVLMLEKLKELNFLPDFCLVAEPTCEAVFGDTIKVGRRGSINGKLKIIGRGGHAAYPEKAVSPIVLVSKILPKLADVTLDNGDKYFAPSKFVVTDIKGGYGKHNVIPSEVEILFNIRNSTATDAQRVEKFIKDICQTEGMANIELSISQSSNSFVIDNNERAMKYFELLLRCVESTTHITPNASTAGGTSDARFIAKYGIDVLEFGVRNESIHAPNENVNVKEILDLTNIFSEFIKRLDTL
jgi:succinyl-diaminopimelate desuccinylase